MADMDAKTEEQVNKMIQDALEPYDKRVKAVEMGGGLAPFHKHNGIDAPQILFKDLSRIYVRNGVLASVNLPDTVGTTTTLQLPGAGLGDFALASLDTDLQGVTCTAYVSANDVVSIRFQNESGGAVTLAGNLRVMVIRKQS